MGKVEEYQIDNKQEIYDSLVQNFEFQVGKNRKKIAQAAKEMLNQLGKKKDSITKEYQQILNQIIKEYSKKQSIADLENEYQKNRFKKK